MWMAGSSRSRAEKLLHGARETGTGWIVRDAEVGWSGWQGWVRRSAEGRMIHRWTPRPAYGATKLPRS